MAKRVRRITPGFLKKIIIQEARKLKLETIEQGKKEAEDVNADEVDADALAGTLEQDLDFIKALKIKEAKMVRGLKRLREQKSKLRRRIGRRI
jgi:hypothetical protein|tara:strand:+ start:472 stop:750 length:279 start_codon:yes stop_codon:yes gene_type:complete